MKDILIVFLLALGLGAAINYYKWTPAAPVEPGAVASAGGGNGAAGSGAPAPLPGPSPEASNLTTGSVAGQLPTAGAGHSDTSNVVGVTTDATFESQVLKSKTPVLVDFYAPWSEPCKLMTPVIEEIANENNGRLKVYRIDLDDNQHTAAAYTDGTPPTFCIFKGGQVIEKFVGLRPKATLVEAVNKVCGSSRYDAFASAPQPGNTALPQPTLTNAATAKNEDIPLIDEVGFDRDVIKSASPVFVYFCDGSEPCSRMWPTVESVANKVFDKYRVVRVDVAAHPTIAQDYYVAATPAYAIFKDGKRYKQLAGVIPEEYLMNFLEVQHTASAVAPGSQSTY